MSGPNPLGRLDFGRTPKTPSAASDDRAGQAEADQLRARVARGLESARALPEIQSAILISMRDRLDALAHDRNHSQKWIEQRMRDVKAEAAKALADAETAAAEALVSVRDEARKATTREPANTADAQLLELKVANAWTGLRMMLEKASTQSDGLAAIEAAAESAGGSREQIEALRRFGPQWVQATFGNETAHARERIMGALNAGVDRAELPTLTPLQRAGRELLQDAERGASRLNVNSEEARREIERGNTAAALAGWDEGATIQMTHRGQFVPSLLVTATFGDQARAWQASAKRAYPMLIGEPTPADQRAARFAELGMSINGEE